jgi:hypothetical protein
LPEHTRYALQTAKKQDQNILLKYDTCFLESEYLQIENHSPQIMPEARNTEYNKESVLRVRDNVTQGVWGNMEMFWSFSLLKIRFPAYTSVYLVSWL